MQNLVKCWCGIFGCDGGCGPLGCGIPCGLLGQIPLVGDILGAFNLCPKLCDPPCGFGGSPRLPPLRITSIPITTPTPNPTGTGTVPTGSGGTGTGKGSGPTGSGTDACTEPRTGTNLHVSCFSGTAVSSTCTTDSSITIGCTVNEITITKHCSARTRTQASIFCASSDTKSCASTSSSTATVFTACDAEASSTTLFPACPTQLMLPPDDGLWDNGDDPLGGDAPISGPADPTCESQNGVDTVVPYDTILKPEIEAFCDRPGPHMMADSSEAIARSFNDSSHFSLTEHRVWHRLCSFGNNNGSVASLQVATSPKEECQKDFKKEDCLKNFKSIADKCSMANNKNEKTDGHMFDQSCFG